MELSDATKHAVIQRYARIRARLGEELGSPPLVLPTADFFPDTFRGDDKSVRRLVKRMQKHAGIDDIPIQVQLVGEAAKGGGGGCGSGACGTGGGGEDDGGPRIVEREDGWLLNVPAAELAHPVVLTANAARSLASIFMAETREDGEAIDEPVDVTVDLLAVQLGFGVLLLSGSYIYSKSCGGPSVGKVTALGPGELGLAVGLFTQIGEHSFKVAARQLDTTQKDALSQAKELVDSNQTLLVTLREAPARLAEGEFKLESATPWLLRALGAGKKKKERTLDEMSLDEMEAMLSAEAMSAPKAANKKKKKAKEDDELGALVAEALREAQTDAS